MFLSQEILSVLFNGSFALVWSSFLVFLTETMFLGDSLSFLFFGLQVSGILIQNQIFLKKNIGAINMHVFFGGLFFFIVSFLSRIAIIMIISITWMIYGRH